MTAENGDALRKVLKAWIAPFSAAAAAALSTGAVVRSCTVQLVQHEWRADIDREIAEFEKRMTTVQSMTMNFLKDQMQAINARLDRIDDKLDKRP